MTERRLDIQRAMVALVKDFEFPSVRYEPDGSPLPTNPSVFEKPITPILFNEVQDSWSIDQRHGRDRIMARNSWTFVLKLAFRGEVLLEPFKDMMANDMPYVSDAKATLMLQGTANIEHPVMHDGKTGTRADFVFQAVEGRK